MFIQRPSEFAIVFFLLLFGTSYSIDNEDISEENEDLESKSGGLDWLKDLFQIGKI